MIDLAVVVGAGPLGRALAGRLLARDDRPVRLISRSGHLDDPPAGLDVRAVDALDPGAMDRALTGARTVYQCAAPPYTKWVDQFPALQRAILDGAARAGARAVVADNLYAYGPQPGPLTESLPAAATDRKGRVRAAMAAEALGRDDLEVTIGRASDFYGPWVRDSVLGERVFPRVLAGQPAQLLGDPDQPHTFSYVEDVAEALRILGDAESAAVAGEIFHVPNAPTPTTRELVLLAYELAGTGPGQLQVMPGFALRIASLGSRLLREVLGTQYQRTAPYVVDHTKFTDRFGDDHVTPHEDALVATLAHYRDAGAGGH